MKEPKHFIQPVFENPISANDLHKIYAAMEEYGKEQYNQAIENAAEKAFRFNGFYESESGSHAIKDTILKLKNQCQTPDNFGYNGVAYTQGFCLSKTDNDETSKNL